MLYGPHNLTPLVIFYKLHTPLHKIIIMLFSLVLSLLQNTFQTHSFKQLFWLMTGLLPGPMLFISTSMACTFLLEQIILTNYVVKIVLNNKKKYSIAIFPMNRNQKIESQHLLTSREE